MKPIVKEVLQATLDKYVGETLYIHLETTNGAYASHNNESFFSAGAYIRNAQIQFTSGKVTGDGPFRVGLKLEHGWVYSEGITDFVETDEGQLLIAGHDFDGKLAVALQLSKKPF